MVPGNIIGNVFLKFGVGNNLYLNPTPFRILPQKTNI